MGEKFVNLIFGKRLIISKIYKEFIQLSSQKTKKKKKKQNKKQKTKQKPKRIQLGNEQRI